MTSDISVALCTHNGERFVDLQLRSILDQSLPPFELVVADDASSDSTVDIVNSFAADFAAAGTRLILITNPITLGVTKNFEKAMIATSGQLIALSDQDDFWHPDRLAKSTLEFDRRPELSLLFTDARLVDSGGHRISGTLFDALEFDIDARAAIRSGDAFGQLLRRNLVTGATVMLRRELLAVAIPFARTWLHDEWLAMLAASVGRVDFLPEQLIDYRQHGSNEVGVVQPTLSRKIARTLQPRGDRNRRLAERADQLCERLETLRDVVPESRRAAAFMKARMEHERLDLPDRRSSRLRGILEMDHRGWYRRYSSQGRMDMVRDLLQPHG